MTKDQRERLKVLNEQVLLLDGPQLGLIRWCATLLQVHRGTCEICIELGVRPPPPIFPDANRSSDDDQRPTKATQGA